MIFLLTLSLFLVFIYFLMLTLENIFSPYINVLTDFVGAKAPVVGQIYSRISKELLATTFDAKRDRLVRVVGHSMVVAPTPLFDNDTLIVKPIADISALKEGVNLLIRKRTESGEVGLKVREFFKIQDASNGDIVTRHHYEGETPKEKIHNLTDIVGYIAYRID